MAQKLLRKAVVLVKVETTYGTDAAPTAADAVLCSVPTYGVGGDKRERNYIRDTLSPLGFSLGAKRQTIQFSCEFKGPNNATTPATATYLDAVLQACGLVSGAGTIGADACKTYIPTSVYANMKSVTIYYYLDNRKHALTGARGTATLEFPVDGFPQINFNFTGWYNAPTDTANPTGMTYPTYIPPSCVGAGFSIGAYDPTGITKLTLDLGVKITEKKDIQAANGLSEILITGREPKLTVDLDQDTLANFNPFTIWTGGTTQAIDWIFGAKGNRVAAVAPAAMLDEPAYADRDGSAIYNLSFQLTGSDDEFTLKTG